MAPSKAPNTWEDEDSSSAESGPTQPVVARRSKFDDEEEEDDVLDSWDAAEDSEVEREKAKKAAEAKAKAEAAAKASHKSKTQRIEERRQEKMRQRQLEEGETSEDEEEDEAERRARLRASEKESDLKNAEDLFADIGISNNRGAVKPVTVQENDDPSSAVDLSKLKVFQPNSRPEFLQMQETLVSLISANSKKAQYALFMPEFCKQICKDLNSEQIKKVASALSTLGNEKQREEKAADKGGKKTKAAKTKTALGGDKSLKTVDTTAYDEDGLDDGDFM